MPLKEVLKKPVFIKDTNRAVSKGPRIDLVKNWEENPELLACAPVLSLVDRHARMIVGEIQSYYAGCDWKGPYCVAK